MGNDEMIKQTLDEINKSSYEGMPQDTLEKAGQAVSAVGRGASIVGRGIKNFASDPNGGAEIYTLAGMSPPSSYQTGIGGNPPPPTATLSPPINKTSPWNPENKPIVGVNPSPIGVTIPEHSYINPPPLEGTYLTQPFAGGVNVKPPEIIPPAIGGGGSAAGTPTEEFPPSWATRNGWNISNEGLTNAKGIGITPMGEQPTAVRISTKDRTGKGMMASAKLETDTKDTTLVANPNYNKMVVDDYGYGKRGMGGNAHIDNRKYIEKENWGKGEKVPLLQAMGFGKRPEPTGIDRAIKNIENDPNMRSGGGLNQNAHKIIADLYGHQETAKLHKDNMEDRLAVMREANEQRGQQNKWAHEDRVQKQELAEAQSFLDLNKAYDFNPETGKEDKVNNWLTTAKMLEATNGDLKKIPKVFRDQAANFQNRFETYFNSGTIPPGADKEKARRIAWATYKEKYAAKKAE